MHPEYPCAHCIISGAVASTLAAVFGTAEIPEVTMTSPTAPGATHRWTNLNAYADEVATARIYAGFHLSFLDGGRPGHGPPNGCLDGEDGHASG
jgi:hypothetical protein